MNPTFICSICGRDTSNVDYDYLIGVDHLACHLFKQSKNTKLEIQNWKKLEGESFHTLGCGMIITDCEQKETCYEAWIYQTHITPSEALIRVSVWFDYEISLKVFPPQQFSNPPLDLTKKITKEHVKNPSIFIATICEMLASSREVRNILRFYQ